MIESDSVLRSIAPRKGKPPAWPLVLAASLCACTGPQVAVDPQWTPAVVIITPTPVPVTPSPTAPNIPTTAYTIKPGETLTQIATRYGLSVDELAALNGLSDPNNIQVGQRIRVPRRRQ